MKKTRRSKSSPRWSMCSKPQAKVKNNNNIIRIISFSLQPNSQKSWPSAMKPAAETSSILMTLRTIRRWARQSS